jgi:hypothetical protein
MRNKDIYTIQRHLFLKHSAYARLRSRLRTRIDWNKVLETLSVFGLILLVGLLLVL